MQLSLYYGDFYVVLGVLIIFWAWRRHSLSEGELVFLNSELVPFTSIFNIDRRNVYGRLLYIGYILPYVLWIVMVMFQKNFRIWEMEEHLLIFTVVGIIIGLVVKLHELYIGNNRDYDFITYITLGVYYIVLGMRNTVMTNLDFLVDLPETTGRVVEAETYLSMALSLTIVLVVSLIIGFHSMKNFEP